MPDSEPPGQQLPGRGGQRAFRAALRHPHDPQLQVTAPGCWGRFLYRDLGGALLGKRDLQGSSLFLGSFALFFLSPKVFLMSTPGWCEAGDPIAVWAAGLVLMGAQEKPA